MKAKQKRIKGPASRLSVPRVKVTRRHDFEPSLMGSGLCKHCGEVRDHLCHGPAAIRSREEQLVLDKRNMVPISNEAMMAYTFNVIHTRICLNDGMSTAGDDSLVREKLFEIIAVRGWE